MARYLGTPGNNSVAGAPNEPDFFVGFGAGHDKVVGGNSNDTFVLTVDGTMDYYDGGKGEDVLDYSHSDQSLIIDLAADKIYENLGGTWALPLQVAEVVNFEDVIGSRFNDRIIGNQGNNVIEGGAGADYIDGGSGSDTASYARSGAAVQINLSSVMQHGGDAEGDQLHSIENVIGSAFDDHFSGSSANNAFDGGGGFDTVSYVSSTGGIDVGLAEGLVIGNSSTGVDTLHSIESIQGSNFADKFDATGFSATSTNGGGAGDQNDFNQFEGMGGNDLIIGNGDTRISYLHAISGVVVDIAAHTATGDSSVGDDTFTGVNNVLGSNFADKLFGSDNAAGTTEKFDGHAGNDLIDGRGGFDLAIYSNDPATHSGIDVHLAAGLVEGDSSIGTDTLLSVEAIRGTNFDDIYDATGFGGTSANAGSLGALNQFEGMGGDDTIIGNGHTRLVFFNATSGVTVNMTAGTASGDASVGHDTFTGVNAVSGSDFADTIIGSHHDDILAGRGGGDTFEFTASFGHDTITDFTAGDGAGHDVIRFDTNSGPTDFAGVQAMAHQVGSDVVIGVDPLNSITLSNVSLGALTPHDFIFS